MLYNHKELPNVASTAGKITILTAIVGVAVFVVAFLVDFSSQELSKVSAQTATTTLTVLNTPPVFNIFPAENPESSTTTPTNSDEPVTWVGTATDANGADWYLLVCSTNATPTANTSAPPTCGAGATQWGVSASTLSGVQATVSTTTAEVAPFAEVNTWYAWACDGDAVDPRCTTTAYNGDGISATSSPFHVNSRPSFTTFANNGPVDPGGTLTFYATSTDSDVVGGADELYVIVCQSNSDYSTTTNSCPSFVASTTVGVTADPTAVYNLASIFRDDTYPAYGYVIDEHGHEAASNPIQANFVVNNVAPTLLGGDIDLNGGLDMTLSVPGGETTGYTLDFTVRDANSCVNAVAGDEIVDYTVAIYRSAVGTTTCDGTAGSYDPNNCYPSGLATTTWNLSCTASSTSCTGPTDDTQIFECTFPLWFVADPTDGAASPYTGQNWLAAVSGIDDDAAASPLVGTTNPVDVLSFSAIDLITAQIPYGALEPGEDSGTLSASTTIDSVGNTGLDQEVEGDSMCGTYAVATPCAPSATSTIPEDQQQFASTSLAYGSPLAATLSSTTQTEIELNVPKTTATSSDQVGWEQGVTYWGIAVPASITLAGSYQGLNTFYAVTDEAWQ